MLKPHTNGVRVRPQPVANPGCRSRIRSAPARTSGASASSSPTRRRPTPACAGPAAATGPGIFNTFFWIDPKEELGVIVMMQMLPFYDDAAIETLQGVEQRVYSNLK